MVLRALVGVLALALCAASASAGPAGIDSLVVFGDSLSDTGNIFDLTSTPFAASLGFTARPGFPLYTQGQFTNGPDNTGPGNPLLNLQQTAYAQGAWHNALADGLGLAHAQNSGIEALPTGTNYAYGGATTAGDDFISLSVAMQVERYLDRPVISNAALHIFWAGSNDLIDAARAPGATPQQVLDAGASAVISLRASISTVLDRLDGAQPMHALWLNLPPLHLVPEGAALDAPLRTALATASATFRTAQLAAADALRAQFPTLDLDLVDIHSLFGDLVANPGAAGLVNVSDPVALISDFGVPGPMTAVQLAPAGANPDQWLFWDTLHPTARGHALIAQAALAAIPAPVSAVPAVWAVMWTVRRRRV